MQEYRCYERLNTTAEGMTRLSYTKLCGELEYLKTETRLTDDSFECVMDECVV